MRNRALAFACAAAATVAAAIAGPVTAASPSPSPSPSPTPNPYRQLNFASASLDARGEGGIDVLRGFAAVKRDGTAAIVCISFKNAAVQTVRRVVFEFPVYGRQGRELGTMRLDRSGEFSPNVAIEGWQSLSDWQGGIGHRGYGDNCAQLQRGMAAEPLLRATGVSYRVARVEYVDGTVWP